MALEPGTRVGDYEILALLGAGGMGQVYSARNIISGRTEAMKVLLPDFASEPELAARFTAEIRTLDTLDHPNIAQLRTAFQFENRLVMIMEFVEGVTLEKRANAAAVPVDEVINYSQQVLAALSYAHSKGVTHRDIKPANIMITSHGLVKLMDFGIAKSTNDLQLTRPGTTMGSVYYMSPEQVRGGTVDARSDIYSFGVTMYEMLTGRRPFQAETAYSVLNAQLTEAPQPPMQVNPALPQELNNIVLRAMVKSPDGRFQTAEEFRAALRNLQPAKAEATASRFAPVAVPPAGAIPAPAAGGVSAMPPPVSPAVATASKGHRGLWIGLGAVTALIALIAAGTVLPRMFSTHADQKAAPPAVTDNGSAAPSTGGASNGGASTAGAAAVGASGTAVQPDSATTANPLTSATSAGATSGGSPSDQPPIAQPVNNPGGHPRNPHPTGGNGGNSGSQIPAPPPGPSREEIAQAHERMIQLSAEADSVRAGIQQIRSQQQAQGLDLRGDVLASLSRMNSYMSEAERSLSQNDVETAQAQMEKAEKEIGTLKAFLGR
ncbi:MAG TPA: serine/threonine-protein kinase [Silvibacterium sp.]|nr:serine/threonine-protein kinase [Silvibacterium sp.]